FPGPAGRAAGRRHPGGRSVGLQLFAWAPAACDGGPGRPDAWTNRMLPLLADVQAAAARIAPHAIRTPLVESWQLNVLTGGRVFLKLETLQRTGSFKFRGACHRLGVGPEKEA